MIIPALNQWLIVCRAVGCLIAMSSVCSAMAAKVSLSVDDIQDRLTITGEISRADVEQVHRLLAARSKKGYLSVSISSEGGSVDAAMRLGRIFRSNEAHIYPARCYSACVIAILGGVTRTIIGEDLYETDIGIHRVYLSHVSPSLTAQQISKGRQALLEKVRSYMQEMRASLALLEAMEAIEPELMRILSRKEAQNYGIEGTDPIYDEREVAREAAAHGVTSIEYRRRRVQTYKECDYSSKDPEYDVRLCREAVLYGLSFEEYMRRRGIFLRAVYGSKIGGEACRYKVIVRGDLTC